MRDLLEQQLKRYPGLYSLVAGSFFALSPLHLMELVAGTRIRERQWARRHLKKGNDWCSKQHSGEDEEWVNTYWDSRYHTHRTFLVEKIAEFYPFTSVLEIGCNCGPNLYLVAKRFPDAEVKGIDINSRSIQRGAELFASEGITNVRLSEGKADRLEEFGDKSVDIVFTDAVLIYVGPDKINRVIREMLRISRRALIFLERHRFEPDHKDAYGLGSYYRGWWLRDYAALLKQFVAEDRVRVTKIPERVWPIDGWKDWGAVIEVALS